MHTLSIAPPERSILIACILTSLAGSAHALQTPDLVSDIRPGPAGSQAAASYLLGDVNNRVVLLADDGTSGFELWGSSGVSAGTERLADINPGPTSTLNVSPLGTYQGYFYFAASNAAFGMELWRTDGTSGGTQQFLEIQMGPVGSTPRILRYDAGTFLLSAFTQIQGTELWTSDGTQAGTHIVVDLTFGPASGYQGRAVALGNKTIFVGSNATGGAEPWVTDGTSTGTVRLIDSNPGSAGATFSFPFIATTTHVFIRQSISGVERFLSTNGTPAGTLLLGEAGGGGIVPSNDTWSLPLGSKLIFAASAPSSGNELWISDGSLQGTYRLGEINPGPADGIDTTVAPVIAANKYFFVGKGVASGKELWRTDGTNGSMQLLAEATPGPADSDPVDLHAVGTLLVYAAKTGSSYGLWYSDGQSAGTHPIAWNQPFTVFYGDGFFSSGGRTYFIATGAPYGPELWQLPIDADHDGVIDFFDNCTTQANPLQGDCDLDGSGDACEIAAGAVDGNSNGIPDACETGGGAPYCFGNGLGTACPCGNTSTNGGGCNSSVGLGGRLRGSGNASIANDTLLLTTTSLPPTTSTLTFQGAMQTNGGAGTVFGDGLRCASGNVLRLIQRFASGGVVQFPIGTDPTVSVSGGALAGQTLHYQVWFRNVASFCTPAAYNLSNGLVVLWAP